jgi:uncharacterized membrane protein
MHDRPSWRWDLLPLCGALLLGAALASAWPGLPERVATHFDAAGRANGWTPKAALPVVMLGVPLLLWVLLRAAAAVKTRETVALAGALAPFRALLVLAFQLLLGIVALAPDRMRWGLGGFLALLLSGAVLLARGVATALPKDPRYRGGLVYYAPEDPRIWVPKRIGLGWTLNFARPLAWLFMALLLALPIGAVVASRLR